VSNGVKPPVFHAPHDAWALTYALGFSRAHLRPLSGIPAAGQRRLDITQQLQQVVVQVGPIATWVQHQIYFCNTQIKHLQHTSETAKTYV
jgi:hypothetical protein